MRFESERLFVVDTKLIDEAPKRSLIFKSSASFVQTEVQLKKNENELIPDFSVLLQRPYQIMLLALTTLKTPRIDPFKVGIIGAGCGALPMYLNHFSDHLMTKVKSKLYSFFD